MSANYSIPGEKVDTASGSSLVLPTSSPASSARSYDLDGSSDSSLQSVSPIFEEGVHLYMYLEFQKIVAIIIIYYGYTHI